MTKLFKDVDSVIQLLIDSAIIHTTSSEKGDYKNANKSFDLIRKAVTYLRENNGVIELKALLKHENASVKLMSAAYLLKHFEKESLEVIENIASQSIPHLSFEAKMLLQEWRKGNINL